MLIAVLYLVDRLFYRWMQFFVHWYGHSFIFVFGSCLKTLEKLDRLLAFKITMRNFLIPLYGDYSFLGRILGVIFRSMRIVVGATIYLMIFMLFGLAYIFWAVIPVGLVLDGIYS